VTAASDHAAYWRRTVFNHYGTACACCGSADRLTIDHIAGDGAAHRAALSAGGAWVGGGTPFYRWLCLARLPAGFQTLCNRCNISKGKADRCRLRHP
jgi:hypothetical protein